MRDGIIQGALFTDDFLRESIVEMPDWGALTENVVDTFRGGLVDVFSRLPVDASPNESQTEDDLIWPVLSLLGWKSSLRQQNLSARGREDVPDGVLFKDDCPAPAPMRQNWRIEEGRISGSS